jgi:hypothetical protein
MHPRVIAQRQSDAHGRIVAAVKAVAANTGVATLDLTAIREKSPDVQRIKEYEALADWLEALRKRTLPVVKTREAKNE